MTGWTWDYVGKNMTMPMYSALYEVWNVTPPPARSLSVIAQNYGLKLGSKKKKTAIENQNAGAARDLANALQG